MHSWAYLPDMALTFKRLVCQADTLPAFSVFHYRGVACSAEQMLDAVRQASGEPVRLKPMSWFPLRVIGLFRPMIQEVLAMRDLWDKSLVLDDGKLQRQMASVGGVPVTPLPEAIKRVLPSSGL